MSTIKTIKVDRKDISNDSDTPIFDYCRRLIAEGISPDTRLEVWRNNPTPDLTIESIGWGATKTVEGWRIRPYREKNLKHRLKAGIRAYVDLNDVKVVGQRSKFKSLYEAAPTR